MTTVLEIDVGNTRTKWRFLDEEGLVAARGVGVGDQALLAMLGSAPAPERVRIACVRDAEFQLSLSARIAAAWCVNSEFARARAARAGLRNAYTRPELLGVDRWLAMLAAGSINAGPYCVLDAGSAVTLDLVDGAGQHLGGYIVPGVAMQRASLLEKTAIRLAEPLGDGELTPGCSTNAAIRNGVIGMLVGWVCDELQLRFGGEAELFLTGGDAPLLAKHLQRRSLCCTLIPDLVLDGLRIELP